MTIKLPTLTCRRCRWKWIPRQPTVRLCPHCKSAGWETKRTGRQGLRTDLKEKKR